MNLIKVENNIALLSPEISAQIAEFERQAKLIKQKEDELKKAILREMEDNGIIKLETDELLISYIAPTDRETLDGKTLRAELPDVFDAYVKMSPVKSSIRIKVK